MAMSRERWGLGFYIGRVGGEAEGRKVFLGVAHLGEYCCKEDGLSCSGLVVRSNATGKEVLWTLWFYEGRRAHFFWGGTQFVDCR